MGRRRAAHRSGSAFGWRFLVEGWRSVRARPLAMAVVPGSTAAAAAVSAVPYLVRAHGLPGVGERAFAAIEGFSAAAAFFGVCWVHFWLAGYLASLARRGPRFRAGSLAGERFLPFVLAKASYLLVTVVPVFGVLRAVPGDFPSWARVAVAVGCGCYLALAAVRLSLYDFFVADGGLGVVEAFRASARATAGRWCLTLGVACAAVAVNALGLAAAGVGLVVTLPVAGASWACLYLDLSSRRGVLPS